MVGWPRRGRVDDPGDGRLRSRAPSPSRVPVCGRPGGPGAAAGRRPARRRGGTVPSAVLVDCRPGPSRGRGPPAPAGTAARREDHRPGAVVDGGAAASPWWSGRRCRSVGSSCRCPDVVARTEPGDGKAGGLGPGPPRTSRPRRCPGPGRGSSPPTGCTSRSRPASAYQKDQLASAGGVVVQLWSGGSPSIWQMKASAVPGGPVGVNPASPGRRPRGRPLASQPTSMLPPHGAKSTATTTPVVQSVTGSAPAALTGAPARARRTPRPPPPRPPRRAGHRSRRPRRPRAAVALCVVAPGGHARPLRGPAETGGEAHDGRRLPRRAAEGGVTEAEDPAVGRDLPVAVPSGVAASRRPVG